MCTACPPAWLIEGLWPADAYGVLAAEDKAGKTWAALDLAVSVAAGHPWFGRFACPTPGRVLVFLGEGGERSIVRRLRASAAVAHRGTTPEGASAVVLGFELVGGEIPDSRFRVRRTVRALDPTDLASPLEYTAEVLADDDPTGQGPGEGGGELRPSVAWVLGALRAGGGMQTAKHLGDRLASEGHPLKKRTIQLALQELEAARLATGTQAPTGRERYWTPIDPADPDGDGDGLDSGS